MPTTTTVPTSQSHQTPDAPTSTQTSSGARVQLKRGLSGQSYDVQLAQLTPRAA